MFSEQMLLVLALSGLGLVLSLLPVTFMCVTDNVGLVVFRDSRVYTFTFSSFLLLIILQFSLFQVAKRFSI